MTAYRNVERVWVGAAVLALACGGDPGPGAGGGAEGAVVASAVAAPATVDSIFPMDVMIERFQAESGERPAALAGGARSRDELVAEFVAAVADSSETRLRELRMDMAEYAYLYVPTSHLTREPYRQPPAMGWMLTEQNGMKGETRLLRRFGGRPVEFRGYDCPEGVVTEGGNRLWRNCVVDLGAGGPMRMFGTIIERDGEFKFIPIANDL